jgi:hypothetical protein
MGKSVMAWVKVLKCIIGGAMYGGQPTLYGGTLEILHALKQSFAPRRLLSRVSLVHHLEVGGIFLCLLALLVVE